MKAIMYHYVREFDNEYPNFRFLDIKNFRKQLDFFEKKYGFVSMEEWYDFTNFGKIDNVKNKVLLTFDDAMKCHFDFVFQELKSRGLWGIFYVPTAPYMGKKILDVHRIHLLCGKFDGKDLLNNLLEMISDDMVPDKKRKEFSSMTYTSQKNSQDVTTFKRILNYFIDYNFRERIIDEMVKKFSYNLDAKKFYVPIESLKKMKENNMIIGSHSVSHPVMSKLSYKEQLLEIQNSFNFLDDIDCLNHKTYCHPYGGFHSFDSNTIKILDQINVKYAFNVESKDISKKHITHSKQYLPRYDCNEFPFGQSS